MYKRSKLPVSATRPIPRGRATPARTTVERRRHEDRRSTREADRLDAPHADTRELARTTRSESHARTQRELHGGDEARTLHGVDAHNDELRNEARTLHGGEARGDELRNEARTLHGGDARDDLHPLHDGEPHGRRMPAEAVTLGEASGGHEASRTDLVAAFGLADDGDWARLERFLVHGSDAGTYHVADRELAIEDALVVGRCLARDGRRTLDRIVAASDSGRAPKNDPAIFALAMTAKLGDDITRRAAFAALPRVCRIGTHLMQFASYAQTFGGWGRGMRKAIGAWFNARPASDLATQLATYRTRSGWTHRDLLRLAHPRAASPSHDRLFAWAVKGEIPAGAIEDPACDLIVGIAELERADDGDVAAAIVRRRRIPAECVPQFHLAKAVVWDALLDTLPTSTLLRSLAPMTRVGLLAAGNPATRHVVARLRDRERLATARLHPLAYLAALVTYRSGRGVRGQGAWLPVAAIVDALEAAFYDSFAYIERTGRRTLVALDVSGSMACGSVGGIANLSPRLASAAMALVTAATEQDTRIVAFTSAAEGFGGQWGGGDSAITELAIAGDEQLDHFVGEIGKLPMGGTDCALPMVWAQKHRVDVDTFVIYTDNETWAGNVHPVHALRSYRDARGIPAKLVVVGMTSTGFSIADPADAGMLDVIGFDPSTPPVIADFARA